MELGNKLKYSIRESCYDSIYMKIRRSNIGSVGNSFRLSVHNSVSRPFWDSVRFLEHLK